MWAKSMSWKILCPTEKHCNVASVPFKASAAVFLFFYNPVCMLANTSSSAAIQTPYLDKKYHLTILTSVIMILVFVRLYFLQNSWSFSVFWISCPFFLAQSRLSSFWFWQKHVFFFGCSLICWRGKRVIIPYTLYFYLSFSPFKLSPLKRPLFRVTSSVCKTFFCEF